MSNEVTTFNPPAALPAVFANAAAAKDDLSQGVVSGFPVISYRGRVWRIHHSGVEKIFEDDNGEPRPSIEVVMVKANAALSKIYYEKAYEEGDNEAPVCWSVDGQRPDPSVQDPVNDTCASCPNNVWGSKITPSGSKTKLCSDSRRTTVAFVPDLVKNGAEASVCLLRIPAASLGNLKEYAEKQLHGYPYYAVLTRISFDTNASYPKLVFRPVRTLNDDECAAVAELQNTDIVPRILYNAEEAPTTVAPSATPAVAPPAATPITKAKAKKKKTVKKAEPAPTPQEEPKQEDEKADSTSMLDDLLGSLGP